MFLARGDSMSKIVAIDTARLFLFAASLEASLIFTTSHRPPPFAVNLSFIVHHLSLASLLAPIPSHRLRPL
jgi:hypothetical protein